MNKQIVKTIATALASGVLLSSLGASAATGHKCPKTEKWDKEAKACVAPK